MSLRENPMCERTHATFRLAGDRLVPAQVTAELGITPTFAHAKGDEVREGRQKRVARLRTVGVWGLGTEDRLDSTSLERHLIALLDLVEPAAEALADVRRTQGLKADLFCYWVSAHGHGGPVFSARTLGRIAALDVELGLDLYGLTAAKD